MDVDTLRKCHEGRHVSITFKGNQMKCGNKTVTLPSYEYISRLVKQQEGHKRRFVLRYLDLVEKYTKSGDPDILPQMNPLVQKIQAFDEQIHRLQDTYARHIHDTDGRSMKQEINDRLAESKEIVNDLSSYDPKVGRMLAKLHKQRKEIFHAWKTIEQQWEHDHMIQSNQIIEETPVANGKLTTVQKQKLKRLTKQKMTKVFKFATAEECTTKLRSKFYFQTKDEIIKEIDVNEKLKKLMPANYKSLSKEQICRHLFKNGDQ